MKRIFFISIMLGVSAWVSAQCTPDTNCIDIDNPGQICPDTLAVATLGEDYQQSITIIAPDTAFLGNAAVKITKIVLDTIGNLPPGITFTSDTNVFFPDTMYCVLLSGIPTDTGTWYLDVVVTPYIYSDIVGEIKMDPVHDDSSMFITVSLASLFSERPATGFSLIRAFPNPFGETTKIGFTASGGAETELVIYNIIGKIMYRENMPGHPGKNYFRFTGETLPPGIYPYFVISGDRRLSGKLIRSK